MSKKFKGFDEEEEDVLAPKEPQVTSAEPEERKAARALRIKRRQEALKKADQLSEEAFSEEVIGPIEEATANATEELQRLQLESIAKVTNVKVTTDEREVIRRTNLYDNMQGLLEKIENEANEAQLQYEVISNNWASMLEIKDPLDIDDAMKEQKQSCDDLLSQKDKVIAELKHELKLLDEAYHDDLQKQDNDIKELSDRIEKQLSIMQRAYQKQLILIEQAITIEREAMIDHNNKRWEALYKQRDKEELAHMDYKFEQLEEYKLQIEKIMWDHNDKYRAAKIELESLIQELQKELEKLKAICIINTEKIGYNYQVLKKREEENVFVRSQQKRKLNKMSDVANSLRNKIRKAAEDGAVEEMRADAEIAKLMDAMAELEKKSRHFADVNNYKFSQVWRMAAARCHELVRRVRQAEVALHAQVLAEPPPLPPPGPPKSPLAKIEAEFAARLVTEKAPETLNSQVHSKEAKKSKDSLVQHILQLVADNTGFLVEDRLLKLIEKYTDCTRNLITLDSIFMALEIQAEEDIELLCKTFLNYAFCPICIADEISSTEVLEPSLGVASTEDVKKILVDRQTSRIASGTSRMVARTRPSLGVVTKSLSAASTLKSHVGFRGHELTEEEQKLVTEADELVSRFGDPRRLAKVGVTGEQEAAGAARKHAARGVTVELPADKPRAANPFLCSSGHPLEIEPMQILTALGEFISVFVPPEKKKLNEILESLKPPTFETPSRQLKTEEIETYWRAWKNQFPLEKDHFWDGLLTGLNNYLIILQERERIHSEVVELRERNTCLRRLVSGSLPELRAAPHKYLRERPPAFTASSMDGHAPAATQLPPLAAPPPAALCPRPPVCAAARPASRQAQPIPDYDTTPYYSRPQTDAGPVQTTACKQL